MVTIASVFGSKPHQRPIGDTPLDAWLRAREISRAEFARQVQVTRRTVNLWCNGQVLPDLVNAFRISELTEGGVAPEMWMGTDLAIFQYRHDKSDPEVERKQKRRDNRKAYVRRVKRGKASGSP